MAASVHPVLRVEGRVNGFRFSGYWMASVTLLAAITTGCYVEPLPPPVSYREDFGGAMLPFSVTGEALDGGLALHIRPGLCRQVAYQAGYPPRVTREYQCRHPIAGVRIDFTLGGLGSFYAFAPADGEIHHPISDAQAADLMPGDIASFFIGPQPVGQLTLLPVVEAAMARRRTPTAEPPPRIELPHEPTGATARPQATACDDADMSGSLAPGEHRIFVTHQTSPILPVFTLKNESSTSNFDVAAFSDSSLTTRLVSGEHTGTSTELIVARLPTDEGYVFTSVINAGTIPATFHLYCHSVNIAADFGTAFFETTVAAALGKLSSDPSDTPEQSRDKGRVIAAIISAVEQKDAAGIAKDVIINELTTRLHELIGYGFVGDLAVNTGVGVVRDIFRDYP